MRQNRHLRALATELQFRLGRGRIERLLEQERRVPRALHIEATNICNAKCVFCAYPQMQRSHATMPMELFRNVLDQYVAMGGAHVSLTPIVGDPFVDRHLFERLDELARRPQIRSFYFFTNAILMTREQSRRLMAYGDRLRVCVSHGGFDGDTYHRIMGVDRFDRVRRNLADFVAERERVDGGPRLEIHVRCGAEDQRGREWERILNWERAGHLVVATIDTYDSWAGQIEGSSLTENGLRPTPMPYKRGACELLYMKPVVLADGRVNACACRDVEAELIVGDVTKEGLEQVMEGEDLRELRERHQRGDFPDVCERCTYYVSVYDPVRSRVGDHSLNWSGTE